MYMAIDQNIQTEFHSVVDTLSKIKNNLTSHMDPKGIENIAKIERIVTSYYLAVGAERVMPVPKK